MSNSCLQDWWNHAWMLAAATAGTALPGLVALSSQGLTAGGVALSLVGSAGGVAAGVLTGRMGNVLHDRMKDGVADPRALLQSPSPQAHRREYEVGPPRVPVRDAEPVR